ARVSARSGKSLPPFPEKTPESACRKSAMAIVVSDTSPLLMLARTGKLDLLPQLYGEVIIPPAVQPELIHERTDLSLNVADFSGISIIKPTGVPRFQNLDPGESEAIGLALEIGASLLLLDDRDARNVAQSCGLKITGLLGVLLEAKATGLIV